MNIEKKDFTKLKLKSRGDIWNIYFDGNHYTKKLNNLTEIIKLPMEFIIENYINILSTFQQKENQIYGMPKILNIYYDGEDFGYKVEKMPGIILQNYMSKTYYPLKIFYQVATTLIPIIEDASKKEIVIKDLITSGNILYDNDKNQIYIIDLDGIQIKKLTDNLHKRKILSSYAMEDFLTTPKYQDEYDLKLWKPSFNIFLFYELFFNVVFNRSLLSLKENENIEEFLTMCGISKNSNLYERILNLRREDKTNSIDIEDFKILSEKPFDYSRKRIL